MPAPKNPPGSDPPDDDDVRATGMSLDIDLERLRAQATGALPLLIDAEEQEEALAEVTAVEHRGASPPRPAALPRGVTASVEVLGGPAKGKTFPLSTPETTLGREGKPSIRILDPKMSRMHAMIFYDQHEFRVRDMKSANGTYLNGSRVVEYVLRDGDKLLVGESTLLFRYRRDRI